MSTESLETVKFQLAVSTASTQILVSKFLFSLKAARVSWRNPF